jgi:hypothetical protein
LTLGNLKKTGEDEDLGEGSLRQQKVATPAFVARKIDDGL